MRSPAPNAVIERILQLAADCDGSPFLTLLERDGRETVLSYARLVARAREWTARYAGAGLQPGDKVVIILEHGEALYTAYLGALLGGFCPAYFAHPSEKIDQARYCESVHLLLERIGGDFVVTGRDTLERLQAHQQVPRGLLDDGSKFDGGPARGPARSPDAQPALFLQFSSGTTGLKKGVAIEPQPLLWQVDAYAGRIGLQAGDRIVSWLPLYHDMGLIACFFLPLLRRTPLVAMSPFDWVQQPALLLDAVTRFRATLMWLPNFAFNFLATRAAPAAGERWDLSSLRAVVNCSEPVLAASHRQFALRFAEFGLRAEAITACYAMAENTFAVTSASAGVPPVTETVDPSTLVQGQAVRPAAGGAQRVVVSSGTPLPDTRISILDARGAVLPQGHVGEIAIRTPCLFSGYYGNREETEAALRDGVFHTGDLGYLRGGELFVIGRIKDTIIIGGSNLFPQDVEAVVNEIEGVIPGRCVAVGIDDPALGTQALVILVETRLRGAAERSALHKRIHEAVAQRVDAVPARIALLEHMWLQKSTSGKLARGLNRDRYLEAARADAGAAGTRDAQPFGGSLSDAIRACVAQAVNAGDVKRTPPEFSDTDDLVRDGVLDSLSVVSLQLALENRFGAASVRPIRERPDAYRSVSAIAAVLGVTAAAGAQPPPRTPVAPVAAPAGSARPEQKYLLAPQMRDVEAQPYDWCAYLMRRGMPHYRSATLNSDEHGFRATWRGGRPFAFAAYAGTDLPQAVVLGNSFAYGIGTTHDAKTVASRLNELEGAASYAWYNFSQRASVTMQERLTLELFVPSVPRRVAWISGVNNLISLIVGEGAPDNPAPFVGERQFAARMMPERRLGPPPMFEARYAAMIGRLENDISAVTLRLAGHGKLLFCLQPSASWVDKALTPEETTLIKLFDAAGAVLQQAHAPGYLGPLHARFARDVAAICRRWNADFVDCNEDPRLRERQWLFIDRTHMTDAGHALVADIVTQWLRRDAGG